MRKEVRNIQTKQSVLRLADITHTIPSDQTVKTKSQEKTLHQTMETEPQAPDAKKVLEEGGSDIPAQSILNEVCKEQLDNKEKTLCQVSSVALEDKGTSKKTEDENQESSTAGGSQSEKKARVLGPTLPPHLAHLKTNTQVKFSHYFLLLVVSILWL